MTALTDKVFMVRTGEVVSVGTELLLGQTLDTNAAFLARQMAELGISSYRHTVVGDNPHRLEKALGQALDDNDLVITSGGLGPTADDLTFEIAARIAGLPLVKDPEIDRDLMARFPDRDYGPQSPYPSLPKGARAFINDQGSAPAALLFLVWRGEKKALLMLPGPPDEMEPLFLNRVRPVLETLCPHRFIHRYIRLFGIGESAAEARIRDLVENQDQVTLAPYASLKEVVFRISQRLEGEGDEDRTGPLVAALLERLGDYVFEVGPRPMEKVLVDLLAERGLSCAFAESCTAGLASATLASVPGASVVLKGGLVIYQNDMKEGLLAVPHEILHREGPVSEATALAMARACEARTGADLNLAITGLAGPGGGSPDLPVGRVYLAIAGKGFEARVQGFLFSGDRDRIRTRAVYTGLDMMRRQLLEG